MGFNLGFKGLTSLTSAQSYNLNCGNNSDQITC